VTDPLFLTDLGEMLPGPGAVVELTGSEGRHAAVVRRIGPGETVVLSDGRGHAITGPVLSVSKTGLTVRVDRQLSQPEPALRIVAVQAVAKGDRSDVAIEAMTEVGVDQIVPWQASRSIVRWSADRAEKSLEKWRSSVREAAKQSRRLWVPEVTPAASTAQVVTMVDMVDRALVLHEGAQIWLDPISLPRQGSVMIIIGPEGGISTEELAAFTAAGAEPVLVSDAVLRTSTAGVVAAGIVRAGTGRVR